MTLLLVYLFTALIISFLCSLVEATLLSTPLSTLKAKAEEWDKQAIKFANDTEYGLGASVWTRNSERGEEFTKQLKILLLILYEPLEFEHNQL